MEYLRPTGPSSARAFSWDRYPQVIARYDFADPTTMLTSGAAYFGGANYLVQDTGVAALIADYPLSMVCFFKLPSPAETGALMWVGDRTVDDKEHTLYVTNTGEVKIQSQDGSGSGTATSAASTYDDTEWHFAAAVFTSATSRKLYVDNAPAVTDTDNVTWQTANRVAIGVLGRSTLSAFSGEQSSIDAAMIFTWSLTDAQIAWLYNGGAGRTFDELVDSNDAANPGVDNLVSYWGLDEHNGRRRDEMDNLHLSEAGSDLPIDGHQGTVEFLPVVEDRAAVFDGTSYLKRDAAIVSAYPFSMVCWFNVTAVVGGGGRGVMWLGDKDANDVEHGMYIVNGVMVAYSKNGAATDGATSVAPADQDDQVWRMVAGVWGSATSRKVSVDGTPTVENATEVTIGAVDRFAIGVFARSTPNVFVADGDKIDGAMVFNIALSDDQIVWLYNGGVGRRYDELVDSEDADNPGVTNLVEFYELSQHQAGRFVTGAHAGLTLTQVGTLTDDEGIAAGQSRPGGVSYVPDLSGNANHLIEQQGAEINKRLFLVEDSVGYAVRTISTSAQALMAVDVLAYAQPVTHFCDVALEGIEAAANGVLFDGTSTNRHILYHDDSGNIAATTNDYPTAITGSAAQDGVEELFVCEFNGASSRIYRDGASADAAGNLGTGQFDPATMGSSTVSGLLTARYTMRYYVALEGTTVAEKNSIGQELATNAELTWQAIEDRAAQFGASSYLYLNAAPVTAYPFSMVCWFRCAAAGTTRGLMWLGDKDYSSYEHALMLNADRVSATSNAGSSLVQALSDLPATQDDGAWHMAVGVWGGATSRKCCVDANPMVEETTSRAVGAIDRITLGVLGRATLAGYIGSGNALDKAMLFSAPLTADQITWLYNTGHGRTLEELEDSLDANNPGVADLVAYYPLDSAQVGGVGRDVKSNYTMAPIGTVTDSVGV